MSEKKRIRKSHIALAIYLILYQSEYFWLRYFDSIDGFLLLLYMFLGFALAIFWFVDTIKSFKEWSISKNKAIAQFTFLLLMGLPFIFPSGIIQWEKYNSPVKWMAIREGAANCTISFILRENSTFDRRDVCFGTEFTQGKYTQKGDTLFLSYPIKEAKASDTLIVHFKKKNRMEAQLLNGHPRPLIMSFFLAEKK